VKLLVLLATIIAGFLVGCTTIPSDVYFGPLGTDGGYSAMRRGHETWAVRYTGNQYMTGSNVRDLTLLTCAEIAIEAGYLWFVITKEINESGHVVRETTLGGVATAQRSSGWSGGVDTLTGSRTTHTKFISQYRYEIQCYHEEPAEGEAFDAIQVADYIRAEYGIDQEFP
jgi:hypothetical protein